MGSGDISLESGVKDSGIEYVTEKHLAWANALCYHKEIAIMYIVSQSPCMLLRLFFFCVSMPVYNNNL